MRRLSHSVSFLGRPLRVFVSAVFRFLISLSVPFGMFVMFNFGQRMSSTRNQAQCFTSPFGGPLPSLRGINNVEEEARLGFHFTWSSGVEHSTVERVIGRSSGYFLRGTSK